MSRYLFALLAGYPLLATAAPVDDEELERWLEEGGSAPGYPSVVAGAELQFIAPVTERSIHHAVTRLYIDEASLSGGWVSIEQCHEHLDPVPDAEVVYHHSEMRNLLVPESVNITSVSVEGQSVQLQGVEREARLCVTMEAQLLRAEGEGRYRFSYGPFQRRFLDGYYPMHVTLQVDYPAERLMSDSVIPEPEEGYRLELGAGRISADAWFTGQLTFSVSFASRR